MATPVQSNFFRGDQSKLYRGAGRIMIAPGSSAKPTEIADVITLTAVTGPPAVAQYEAVSPWTDLGFTTQGIQLNINNTEEGFDVDQVIGLIGVSPTGWTCDVQTRLAEPTLDHMIIAWEGAAKTTDATTTPPEEESGFGSATSYTERRGAVLFQRPDLSILAFFFHRWVRAAQQSTLDFQKGGNVQQLPVQFSCLADTTETDPRKQFYRVRSQVPATTP